MKNRFLKDKVAADIDKHVARVLGDLGTPEPPLRLEIVRDLLELDRQFYSKDDPSVLDQVAHKLRLSGKQVLKRPTLVFDAIKKFDLRALYLPDTKRILVDSDLPKLKHRWAEAHEIGHDLVPWHHEMMLGDTRLTLNPGCHSKLEAEANYAAGRLLFLQGRFEETVRSSSLNLEWIRATAKKYGNTITTTLWRAVEHLLEPALALISCHPIHPPDDWGNSDEVEHFVRSRAFADRFAAIRSEDLFAMVQGYCMQERYRGPLGSREIILPDDNNEDHRFTFETFFNGHRALTLALYAGKRNVVVTV
ncbi:DUF955 domain-containing protein [Planctomycetales bacterium ZRK34]|nr:DUF955 domain-containing protein [Planctomycetales bacterium ZRK34]